MPAPAPKLPDLALATRCASGEQAASRELFRRYQGRVQATLYRVFGSNRDMDDLLQEVFLQVFRALPSYRGDAQLSTWIHRIAIRVAYRYLKKSRRAALPPPIPQPDLESSGPVRDLWAREGLRRFYEVLDEISPAGRIAFVLFEVEGLTVAQVAERVGASVTTTKLRIWRARKAIRRRAADDAILSEFLEEDAAGEKQ